MSTYQSSPYNTPSKAACPGIIVHLFTLLTLISAVASPAQSLVVSGSLSVFNTQSKRTMHTVWQHSYRVQLNAGTHEWFIEDLTADRRMAYIENGVIIFRTLAGNKSEHIELSSLAAGYPLDLDADIAQIWTVFCGGEFLLTRNNEWFPMPYGDLRLDLYPLATRAVLECRGGSMLFPERIDFIMDHALLTTAADLLKLQSPGSYLEERAKTLGVLQQYITQGSTTATLRVHDWLNLNNLHLPNTGR
jgi:hypothetical protein